MKWEDIDVDEFLAGVDELDKEAGDWRQHLPYEAARQYRTNPAMRAKYSEHANSCPYCQELIKVFGSRA